MQSPENNGLPTQLARRRFMQSLGACAVLAGVGLAPRFVQAAMPANSPSDLPVLEGPNFDISIEELSVNFTGRPFRGIGINGSVPAPTLRMREGDEITIRVTNRMQVTTSLHWHGIILPETMDGVPGLSFDGIQPGETFIYQFKAQQHGTYWYHSHSAHQEQMGLYGALIIEPRQADIVRAERDYVILLSDWADATPQHIYAKLKKLSHYYNTRERTLGDFMRESQQEGVSKTFKNRQMWNDMRMSDRDISDVTGKVYTFLANGQTPKEGWEGLFKPGERVRLRFINGSAMTFFDVRIPGLKMQVISSDGQYVRPVSGIDEIRIGVAETYDVIVQPAAGAYTIFAQAIDRSGYARGTLTSRAGQRAAIPPFDAMPVLSHADMGMGGMDMNMGDMAGMDHSAMGHGSSSYKPRVDVKLGAHVDMMATNPQVRLNDPGVGLRNNGRRVLAYSDLRNLTPTRDKRPPSREIELHLTGNMSRYMWSINGVSFMDAKPIALQFGERVRITFINNTMMNHPMHLHGMWSELETGDPNYLPRKHTVVVQPGAKISYLVTADAKGQWAYHCHMLYHMDGMMRTVVVA
jgi:CopA family copper-resistance protein